MYKLNILQKLLLLCAITQSYAVSGDVIANEALLVSCQSVGHILFASCVVVPPADSTQAAICAGLYAKYMACSTALNMPMPMVLSLDPDPYKSSPYTPCRYEVGHVILFDICPNIP